MLDNMWPYLLVINLWVVCSNNSSLPVQLRSSKCTLFDVVISVWTVQFGYDVRGQWTADTLITVWPRVDDNQNNIFRFIIIIEVHLCWATKKKNNKKNVCNFLEGARHTVNEGAAIRCTNDQTKTKKKRRKKSRTHKRLFRIENRPLTEINEKRREHTIHCCQIITIFGTSFLFSSHISTETNSHKHTRREADDECSFQQPKLVPFRFG